jgi:hypothetical protein
MDVEGVGTWSDSVDAEMSAVSKAIPHVAELYPFKQIERTIETAAFESLARLDSMNDFFTPGPDQSPFINRRLQYLDLWRPIFPAPVKKSNRVDLDTTRYSFPPRRYPLRPHELRKIKMSETEGHVSSLAQEKIALDILQTRLGEELKLPSVDYKSWLHTTSRDSSIEGCQACILKHSNGPFKVEDTKEWLGIHSFDDTSHTDQWYFEIELLVISIDIHDPG